MKYIIFRRKLQGDAHEFIPILIPDCATHSRVSIGDEYKPDSAGFCFFNSNQKITVDFTRRSDSLNMGPKEQDEILLNSLITNSGHHAFIKYD